MTDKEKIREEVEKLKSNLIYGACSSQIAMETMCKEEAYNEVLAILDTLKEEPVSEELEKAAEEYIEYTPRYDIGYELEEGNDPTEIDCFTIDEATAAFIAGAKWQKEQFEKERLKHCDGLTDEQAQIESDFVTQHLKDNNRTPTFIDAIEYGMKMQKEQMVAKAIDGIARPDDDEVWCDLKSFNFKDGDKVKVIVIKED